MIIEQLDLIAFGNFTNRSIDLSLGPRRFHIVYGPNESGKSTSLRAINDWLFGFETKAVDDYVHNTTQLRVGGRLAEPESNLVLNCIRRKGNKDTLLAADNKTKIDSRILDSMLQGISKVTFAQQFGISHQQLVDGGQLILKGEGDIGEILFSAGAGLSQLKQVRERLLDDRKKLFSQRSTTAAMATSLKELDELRAQLRSIAILPTTYNRLRERLTNAVNDEKSNRQRLHEASAKRTKLDAFSRSAQLFVTRRLLQEQLEPVKSAILLDASFTNLRRDLNSRRINTDTQINRLKAELSELQDRLNAIELDERWLQQEVAIEQLNRSSGQYEQTSRSISAKEARRAQVVREIDQHRQSLDGAQGTDGAPSLAEQLESMHLSDASQAEIRALTNQYSGVMQRYSQASEQFNRTSETHRKLEKQLKIGIRSVSPAVLDEAIRSTGNPQHLLAAESRCRAQVESLRDKVNLLLHQLLGFDGTVEQAIELHIPSDSSLAFAEQGIEEIQRIVNARNHQHQQAIADHSIIQARLDSQNNTLALPDINDLDSARLIRDSLLSDLLDAATSGRSQTPKQAIELRDAVLKIDRIYTLLHDHHDHVLRKKQDERLLQESDGKVTALLEAQKQTDEKLQVALNAWKSMWLDIGVAPGDIAEMREWRDIHGLLVETAAKLSEACVELRQATAAVRQAANHLRSAIELASPNLASPESSKPLHSSPATKPSELPLFAALEPHDEPDQDSADLLRLFANAVNRRAVLIEQETKYQSVQQQYKSVSEELERSRISNEVASKQVDAWHSRWTSVVEPLASLGQVTPDSIDLMLRCVNEIAALRRELFGIDTELQQMRESQASFREAVFQVSMKSDPAFATSNANRDEVAQTALMVRQLQQQLANKQHLETLAEQAQKSSNLKRQLESERGAIDAELQSLCSEAGCDSSEQLVECERASDLRRELTNELNIVETQLRIYAANDSVEQFESEAAKYDGASLGSEIDDLRLEIEKREAELVEQQRSLGVLEAEVASLDGSAQAATLLQEQQNLLARIRRQANEYATLTIAQEVLSRAVEYYRGKNEGSVVDRAKDYFCRMTCGQYASLHVDFDDSDKPTLFAVQQRDKAMVPANRLSDGTADALYLAMRIASLEVHLRSHKPIPLIVDDCLIQFDDDRAAATLRILSELSLKTQVILFTHHAHLVQLATENLASDEFYLHQLEA